MADGDGGGSSAGIAVIVAVLIGFVAGGRATTETTTTTNSGSTTSSSSSSGSGSTTTVRSSSTVVTSSTTEAPTPLASCPGSVVRQTTENGITLRIYYDSQAGGVNCVSAVHDGAVTPPVTSRPTSASRAPPAPLGPSSRRRLGPLVPLKSLAPISSGRTTVA